MTLSLHWAYHFARKSCTQWLQEGLFAHGSGTKRALEHHEDDSAANEQHRQSKHADRTSFLVLCSQGWSFLLAILLNNFLLHIRGHKRIAVKHHAVLRTTLGHRAQIRHVLEHVGQGNPGLNGFHVAALGQLANQSTTGIDVADDLSHELLRGDDINLHDGFHELRLGFDQALTSGSTAGKLKSHDR